MSFKIFILLILFQIKHFVADYPLQNEYMLGKFKEKGWILPLFCHSGVHAIITFIISLFFVDFNVSICVGLFDFAIHFTMDRIKASPKMLGKYSSLTKSDFETFFKEREVLVASTEKRALGEDFEVLRAYRDEKLKEFDAEFEKKKQSNKKFWWSLGLDQGVHHLTHYIIIGFLI